MFGWTELILAFLVGVLVTVIGLLILGKRAKK